MKRICVIILSFIAASASAQNMPFIGIDAGGTIRTGETAFSAGYGFHEHWSASWEIGVDLSEIMTVSDSEQKEHLGEFEESSEKASSFRRSVISAQYWIDRTFQGAYIKAGAMVGRNFKADCMIGIGYFIPVWKGIRASFEYETGILDPTREDRISGKGITIGICWIIRTRRQ